MNGLSVASLYRITDRNQRSCFDLIRRYSAFKCGDADSVSFFGGRLAWKIVSLYGREILADRAAWAVIPAPRKSILRAANHLGRSVAHRLGLEYLDLQLASRSPEGRNYSKLSREERRLGRLSFDLSIQGVETLEGRRVLLLDDCVTTGETMRSTVEGLDRQYRPHSLTPIALLRLDTENPESEHEINTAWLRDSRPEELADLVNHPESVLTKYSVEHLLNLNEKDLSAVLKRLSRAGIEKLCDATVRHRSDGHDLPGHPLLLSERDRRMI